MSTLTLDFSDPTTVAGVAGFSVTMLGCFCYMLVSNIRQTRRTHDWINLHQPLHPSAIDLRLDAALRDAEDGFNVCDACEFENLKRSIFCTLCGAPVIDPSSKTKRKDKQLESEQLASASANSRRQSRARKRKEWVREVNADGKLYWLHGTSQGEHSPGFVVQFLGDPLVHEEEEPVEGEEGSIDQAQPQTEPTAEDHVAVTIDGDVSDHPRTTAATSTSSPPEEAPDHSSNGGVAQSDLANDPDEHEEDAEEPKPKIVFLPFSATSERLAAEIATHPMLIVNASGDNVDPSRPAIVLYAKSQFREEPKALVANAKLNFPSKMAEFVTRSSTAMLLSGQSMLKFKIRRDELLADSLLALAATPASCSRCSIRMTFIGEQGIDAGGVYREWLVLVNEQLVSSQAGVFRCVDSLDRSFYLNPTSHQDIGDHHLAHIFATGRLLGRMLLEGNVTGFHLALPLLKIIVGQPVTLSDLEYFDAETYKSLLWVLENDGVDALGLDFTVTEQTAKGETIVAELIPNGSLVDVTDANKREYVERKLQYLLFGSVQSQLFAFLKGLYEVMPPELLMLFDAEELDYVLSGSDEIDVDDWERNSKFTANLIEHPVRGWFWELVREMPNEYRRRLLQFSTGSSRVPHGGFASLTSYDGRLCPFMLKGVKIADSGEYIHSHACFNRLDLPLYTKKKDLKAMLYGILDSDIHGFTTA